MSEEIRIRPVAPDDLPVFFEHQADAEAARMATVEPRDRASFEDHWAKTLRDERAILRAVEADGVVVGNVVSWEHEGEREVGYWIGREHWGRGLGDGRARGLRRGGHRTTAVRARRQYERGLDPGAREV